MNANISKSNCDLKSKEYEQAIRVCVFNIDLISIAFVAFFKPMLKLVANDCFQTKKKNHKYICKITENILRLANFFTENSGIFIF